MMKFYRRSGIYAQNRYAIVPKMVSRKGRRGRSARQRRNAENAYQRREILAAARLMAVEAGQDNNTDNNGEDQKPAQPSGDACTDGMSKIFCFDEAIFSEYCNEELERLLIGPGRKRHIRRVKRRRDLNEKVKQFLIGRGSKGREIFSRKSIFFTHLKENMHDCKFAAAKSSMLNYIFLRSGRKLARRCMLHRPFCRWRNYIFRPKVNMHDCKFAAAKSGMLNYIFLRSGKKLARRCMLHRPFCRWRNYIFRDMHNRWIALRLNLRRRDVHSILKCCWREWIRHKWNAVKVKCVFYKLNLKRDVRIFHCCWEEWSRYTSSAVLVKQAQVIVAKYQHASRLRPYFKQLVFYQIACRPNCLNRWFEFISSIQVDAKGLLGSDGYALPNNMSVKKTFRRGFARVKGAGRQLYVGGGSSQSPNHSEREALVWELCPVNCWEVSALRSAILPSRFKLDPSKNEENEKLVLRAEAGFNWKDPQLLFGYSKDSEYKDLGIYFDHGDTNSPVNQVATKVFRMYGFSGQEIDWNHIRGSVIIFRMEPSAVTNLLCNGAWQTIPIRFQGNSSPGSVRRS